MRMWMVNPEFLCRRHLLGEHVECHMFVGTLNKKKSVRGYLKNKLLEIHNLRKRHDALVKEMEKRGMKHKSPLPDFDCYECGEVDVNENEEELNRRCPFCRRRMERIREEKRH